MRKPKTFFWIGLSLLVLALVSARFYQALSNNIYLPVVIKQPSSTVTPVPCPSETPAPVQMFTYNGVQGNYFRTKDNRNCFNHNEDVWVEFGVTNINNFTLIDVGGLGVYWSIANQASWGDFDFLANSSIDWTDHLNIPNSGTYQVRLGVCFLNSRPACNANPGAWNALSGPITIVIR